MANIPEYPPLQEYRAEIKAASFNLKFRGYAPEEVDSFLDHIVDYLNDLERKLEELKNYETWLRVDVHSQVVGKAQQEARKILQDAQDKSRTLIDSTRADMEKEQKTFHESIQQYTRSWNEQKEALEQELAGLRQYVRAYRAQSARALEESLNALKSDQQKEDREAAAHKIPPLTAPASGGSTDDIDRLLQEIRAQVEQEDAAKRRQQGRL